MGQGKKGSVNTLINKVCPGSQHLFNTKIPFVHLKNLFMRMECLLLECLQPGAPLCPPHLSPVCCSDGSQPTLAVPHAPLLGVAWTPSCCVPCSGTLGAAAKAPRQPVRHSHLPVQRAHFLGYPLSGSGAGLREEGDSGNAAFRVPGLQLLLPCIILHQSCITLHHSFLLLDLCWAWWWWWPQPWWWLWPQRWWPWPR